MNTIEELVDNYDYLPKFIRDEKGQKLFFNLIVDFYKGNVEEHNIFNKYPKELLYSYIFDIFFKSAFNYGYTLQKTRMKNIVFYSLEENIKIQAQKEELTISKEDFELLIKKEDSVKAKNLSSFRESLKYLPDLFPDFDKGRDYFKMIHGFNNSERYNSEKIFKIVNFRDGQILIVDWVLWFLAMFGYKLQRSRKKYIFLNYDEDLEKDYIFKRENTANFLSLLNQSKP